MRRRWWWASFALRRSENLDRLRPRMLAVYVLAVPVALFSLGMPWWIAPLGSIPALAGLVIAIRHNTRTA